MRPEKQLIEKEYKNALDGAGCVVVTNYRGLSAEALNRLRGELEDLPADYLVVKNRIFKRLLAEAGMEELAPFFKEQTGLAFGGDNLPEVIKALAKFIEEEEVLEMRTAVWNGDYFDQTAIKRLVELPCREVLLAQVVSGIQSPLSGLVGVFNQLLSSIVWVLKEVGDQKTD